MNQYEEAADECDKETVSKLYMNLKKAIMRLQYHDDFKGGDRIVTYTKYLVEENEYIFKKEVINESV